MTSAVVDRVAGPEPGLVDEDAALDQQRRQGKAPQQQDRQADRERDTLTGGGTNWRASIGWRRIPARAPGEDAALRGSAKLMVATVRR